MRFDRSALGGGLHVSGRLENGKALLEYTVSLAACGREEPEEADCTVELLMLDREGREVAAAVLPVSGFARGEAKGAGDEIYSVRRDTVKSLLIYPRLWRSVEEPYLYTVQASLLRGGALLDEVSVRYPLRSFSRHPVRGYLLNDAPFQMRGVSYGRPRAESRQGADAVLVQMEADLNLLLEMGANTLFMECGDLDARFVDLCERRGILIWCGGCAGQEAPVWSGAAGCLLTEDRRRKRDLFYYYKACWSGEPFLHLCRPEPGDGGTATVRVYSNQKKAALYVDGVLFEWKESAPSFVFEEVSVGGGDTVLSAQSGDLYTALTVRGTVSAGTDRGMA